MMRMFRMTGLRKIMFWWPNIFNVVCWGSTESRESYFLVPMIRTWRFWRSCWRTTKISFTTAMRMPWICSPFMWMFGTRTRNCDGHIRFFFIFIAFRFLMNAGGIRMLFMILFLCSLKFPISSDNFIIWKVKQITRTSKNEEPVYIDRNYCEYEFSLFLCFPISLVDMNGKNVVYWLHSR